MKKLMKIFLLATAFVPLIYDASVFFPDSAGKIFFVRLILVLTAVLFLSNYFFSKSFRNEITQRAVLFLKNPLVLSFLTFVGIFIISAIFAVDTYTAFWGDVQRGEGLVGIVFLLTFFIFSLLIFEKKDWLWFFKLSLLTAFILLGREFWQFLSEVARPGSFVGNPTFLAGYLIFAIFSSIIVWSEEKDKLWKYLAPATIALSGLGIFITETRGAMLGLALGLIGILIYGVFRGHAITYKSFNFRKISIVILCSLLVFSGILLATRQSPVWQKVPGLARMTTIGLEDISTRTRLFGIKSSLKSVDPQENGWKKLAVGWGPNNYILAFGKYYHTEQYKYEIEWFDRAHNKLLDVLVMNGLLGLLAYLFIWLFYFKNILRKGDFSPLTVGFIFYGISFFVHLLFVFDHIATWLPFLAVLSFIVYNSTRDYSIQEIETPKPEVKKEFLIGIIFSALAVFLCYVFLRGDVVAYMQMKKYLAFKNANTSEIATKNFDSMFEPFTIAQTIIRRDFLLERALNIDSEPKDLLDTAFSRANEYTEKMPLDFRFLASIAGAYTRVGNETKDTLLLKTGEKYLKEALAFSPGRPDFIYGLALNLAYQKKYDESFEILDKVIEADSSLADSYYYYGSVFRLQGEKYFEKSLDYFEKSFNLKTDLFSDNKEDASIIYSNFVKYFFSARDKQRFVQVAKRLSENDSTQSAALDQMIQYVEEQGVWPKVEFK